MWMPTHVLPRSRGACNVLRVEQHPAPPRRVVQGQSKLHAIDHRASSPESVLRANRELAPQQPAHHALLLYPAGHQGEQAGQRAIEERRSAVRAGIQGSNPIVRVIQIVPFKNHPEEPIDVHGVASNPQQVPEQFHLGSWARVGQAEIVHGGAQRRP